jgi:GR25 family glycosyltransferase involved in LPS biosynthesis
MNGIPQFSGKIKRAHRYAYHISNLVQEPSIVVEEQKTPQHIPPTSHPENLSKSIETQTDKEQEPSKFILQDHFEVYTVAYNSPERAAQMTERFAKIGLSLTAHPGVQMDDPRLDFGGEDMASKRLASVFYGHLDNIAKFYETGKPYGLFCEDDVHIHKSLGKELPIIMGEFNAMQLDILLLGYMTTKTIEWWQASHPLVYDGGLARYRYHRYPQDQWGIHLFMISRSYAKTLLEVYGPDYAAKAYKDPALTCCNPDWTLSKYTHKRALRYPMLAVEDGKGNYDHHGQGEFHRESHKQNYREDEFY